MASCLIWECEASQCETTYLEKQVCSATNSFRASSSSSIRLPTSYSSTGSPLLLLDPEGSPTPPPPGVASVLSASAQLGPRSWAFSALAPGSPPAPHHLHRKPVTPQPALTCEKIANQILSAPGLRHRPQEPPSPCLGLLHGHVDLLPLQSIPPDRHTPHSRPSPTLACRTGPRARTAPTWSSQLLPAHAASPPDGSSVPNPIAFIW